MTEYILNEYAERQGWDIETQLILALEYISAQKADDAFEDFLRRRADEENAECESSPSRKVPPDLLEMIDIPAGDLGGRPVAAFKAARTPTTVAQYAAFVAATGHREPWEWTVQLRYPDKPVVYVSAPDAEEFCRWAGLRLLTGDEWEYACRANGPDQPENILDRAWCRENSEGRVHSVGEKEPNAFGLYDMLGNVWEWTGEEESCAVGSSRVLRGGGWSNFASYLRASNRSSDDPACRSDDDGFRCGVSHPSEERDEG